MLTKHQNILHYVPQWFKMLSIHIHAFLQPEKNYNCNLNMWQILSILHVHLYICTIIKSWLSTLFLQFYTEINFSRIIQTCFARVLVDVINFKSWISSTMVFKSVRDIVQYSYHMWLHKVIAGVNKHCCNNY